MWKKSLKTKGKDIIYVVQLPKQQVNSDKFLYNFRYVLPETELY